MQLGLTYLNRGNSEQAKYNLDKAIEYAPELEDVHVAMAYYYQTVGDLVRTEQAYQDAINTKDASGDSMNNFGVFLCQQKQYEKLKNVFGRDRNAQIYAYRVQLRELRHLQPRRGTNRKGTTVFSDGVKV